MMTNSGMNPSLTARNQQQWPTYQRREFQRLVNDNHKRVRQLAPAQLEHFHSMFERWVEYAGSYQDVPDPLAEARACRDVLNVVVKR